MTLRRRTFTYLTILFALMIVILIIALQQIIFSGFASIERAQVTRNIWRANYALQGVRDDMLSGLTDWSDWDETYSFAQNADPVFVERNLSDSVLEYLNLDFMMIIDPSRVERLWFPSSGMIDADGIYATLSGTTDQTLRATVLSESPGTSIAVIDHHPLLIAVRPILKSDGSGEPAGLLVWGRMIDDDMLARFSNVLRLDMRVNVTDAPLSANVEESRRVETTGDTIIGRMPLTALGGALEIEVIEPREVFDQARVSLWGFTGALVVFGGILIATALYMINRLILRRIKHISDAVKLVGKGSAGQVIPLEGSDELTALTRTINTMLEENWQSRAELQTLNTALEERVAERTIQLATQEQQLRAIVDMMGEGLVYSVDGNIEVVNPALADMVGYSTEELIGKPFKSLTPKIDMSSTQNLPRRAERYETKLVRRDGSTIEVGITATPVQMNDGKRRRVVIIRDITQEAAMKQQKDYFFARASHELRTPLSNIMTRLYLLERDPEQFARHLAVLNKVSRQMQNLLNELLTIARLETTMALTRRPMDLAEILHDVIEIQEADAELKHMDLTATLPDTPLMVFGDPTRIHQVFTNLIRNAVFYTPEGGKIDITTAVEDDGGCIVVRVRDNGVGIEMEHLPHLFDPFFRVTEGGVGAGLGLYITREIVNLHGGSIDVNSVAGQGTTFSVRFQAYTPTLTPSLAGAGVAGC